MKKQTKKKQYYPDPTKDPEFEAMQEKWYKKIAETKGFDGEKFKDIEDHTKGNFEQTLKGRLVDANHGGRPLKSWSGYSLTPQKDRGGDEHDSDGVLDQIMTQPANSPIISSFPEGLFHKEEQFADHPEFKDICKSICSRVNSSLTPAKIAGIWTDYCNGISYRVIGRKYKIHNTTVMRAIHKMNDWLTFLSAEGSNMDAKVITRQYDPIKDNPLIYSTWRNSLFYDKKRDPSEAPRYYRFANMMIHEILSHPEVIVRIACLEDDEDHIIGYAVMIGGNIEFTYVKIDYRGNKVATLLTKGFSTVSMPQTKIGKAIVEKKDLKLKR